MLSTQWFVKMEPLAKPAIEAVEQGKTKFVPESWSKTFFHWMNNIRDWCISRQLWWGHRIPAWYCGKCGETTVARTTPTACGKCAAPATELKQDEDVLDTWFSSWLWPFATLGWPERDARAQDLLPDDRPRHRLRHPLLLGGPHDDGGAALHEEGPLPDRLPAHDGDGREGREDVEGEGEHHRPRRDHRPARRRRAPLRARLADDAGGAGEEHQVRRRQRRGRAPLRQQDLERRAVRADEPRGVRRRSLRRPAGRRPRPRRAGSPRALDPLARAARLGGGRRRARGVPDRRRRAGRLPLRLGRAVRLVHRARQGGLQANRRRLGGRSGGAPQDPGDAGDRARDGDAAPPPVHALPHRGDLAEAPQGFGVAPEHHDHALPGARRALPRRRLGGVDGARAEDHRRRPRASAPSTTSRARPGSR